MWGTSNNRLLDEMHDLKLMVIDLNTELKALKGLVIAARTQTLANGVAIKAEKQPVRVIEKEIVVERARKKPRERMRTTGGKKITEAEVAEFIKLFDQGLSFTEISGQTGRSASAIGNKIYEARKVTLETD